jgi:putative Mg2+ transporter-C (MgtC) family protein
MLADNAVTTALAANAESLLGLVAAAVFGGLIGLEREASGKPAGFRTHLLICLGAALITDLSILVASDHTLPGGLRADPGRIAAQIVSGVGFLGAGTILHSAAASRVSPPRPRCGSSPPSALPPAPAAWVLAVAGTILVLLALRFLGRFENRIIPGRTMERVLHVVCEPDDDVLRRVDGVIAGSSFRVTSMEVEKGRDGLAASFDTRGPGDELTALVEAVLRLPGVRRVTLH